MRQFGLIGYPLSHSFSQKYFTDKFEREGLKDCSYKAFPVKGIGELPKLLASHPESSKGGYLSSHPSTDERMRHLRELAASFNGK